MWLTELKDILRRSIKMLIWFISMFKTYKGHTRDAGPGFYYSCRKHFLLTNNETRVSGVF